ncbi:DUF6292 family protein [Streptomyces sp. NPDC002265]|uniref:DUF6292 family protein n=1 Tax=Streptomyces sp. NPDC002265 TaxID=3154415 RepID=UPI00331CD4ED
MLLDPPGLIPTWPQDLPHWPYVQAVDEALTRRDIPPGTVRADHTGRERGERMYMVLAWDVSRTAGGGGIRLHWHEETGWAYALIGPGARATGPPRHVDALHHAFATPEDVAEVADRLVRVWRRPHGEYSAEWEHAAQTRAAIKAFRVWRRHTVG